MDFLPFPKGGAELLLHSDICILRRPFQTRSRGCTQAKTSERRHGWETLFKPTLLLRAEGWRPSDRKGKHLTPLVGRFYAKTACQMLACSTIQVQLHSHLAKIIPTNGVKCASQLWGRRRRTRRR